MQTIKVGPGRYADVDAYGAVVAVWEHVRPLMLAAGDETPAGVIVTIEYLGEVGAVFTVAGGRTFRRGIDDVVARRVAPVPDPRPVERVATVPAAGCRYCARYGRACGRHESPTDGNAWAYAELAALANGGVL
jgi:hypothetical protein